MSEHDIPYKHDLTYRGLETEVKEGKEDPGKDKTKLTRNRKPSSCAQCRKKKLRCNRGNPCTNCISKNELCDWHGAIPLFDSRVEHDATQLRLQVSRLEELVKFLTAQEGDRPATGDLLNSVDNYFKEKSDSPLSSPPLSTAKLQSFPKKNALQSHIIAAEVREPKMDLRALDLSEALSQLVIREFVVLEGSGGNSWSPCGGGSGSGAEFIEEAKAFIASMPQRFGITASFPSFAGSSYSEGSKSSGKSRAESRDSIFSPATMGMKAFHSSAPPLSEVLKYLPTDKEALSAYTYYSGYVSWYSHPVHLPTFEAQWQALKQALLIQDPVKRELAIDPFFVATYLGIIGIGLASMPIKRAIRDGFGDEVERTKRVDRFFEGAMVALSCGRFLDNPSLESIRAVVVISTYFVFMATGESSGAGMGLLSLSVQVALSLSLHRDPNKTPGKFTFFEAEERRRIFWSLFMLCILSSASLGRTWAVFDLSNVDTELPYDAHDAEILNEATAKAGTEARRRNSEETPMTSLLVKIKLSVLAKKINEKAFGIQEVGYSTVMELDADLIEFEASVPKIYQLRLDTLGRVVRSTAHVTVTEMRACMIQISLASEFIRIHRPYVGRRDIAYDYSRLQSIKYSKLLLAIYRTPSCCKVQWGGLTYKATSAATVLAIEIISYPEGSNVDALRASIKTAAAQMETFNATSSLCRKGSRLLRFLLEKEAAMIAQREAQRESKRSRRDIKGPLKNLFNEGTVQNSFSGSINSANEFYHKNSLPTPSTSTQSYQRLPYQISYPNQPYSIQSHPRSYQYDENSRNEIKPLPISRYPIESYQQIDYKQLPPSSSSYNPIQNIPDFSTNSRNTYDFDFAVPPPSSSRYNNPPSAPPPLPRTYSNQSIFDGYNTPSSASPYLTDRAKANISQSTQAWVGGISLQALESNNSNLSYH